MEILEGIFVKKDQKWVKKNPTYANICRTIISCKLVQKMLISSLRNRNLVQISTKNADK